MDARGWFIRVVAVVALVVILLEFAGNFAKAENLVKMYEDSGSHIDMDTDVYHRSHGIELVRIRVRMHNIDTYQTYLIDARANQCCLIDVDGKSVSRSEREWVTVALPMAGEEVF